LINVYDLDSIEADYPSEGVNEEALVKTRRVKPNENKTIYLFSLNSSDFIKKKNKKINCVAIANNRGLIFAGCYAGDIFVWRTDIYRRDRIIQEAYELVTKVKAHGGMVHLVSVSPDENYFLTGSVDGSANVWRMPENAEEIKELINELEQGNKEGGFKKSSFKKNLVKPIDCSREYAICQCVSAKWSWRGRYALATFGGKEEDDDANDDTSIVSLVEIIV
jgi:WD40 repeat protein